MLVILYFSFHALRYNTKHIYQSIILKTSWLLYVFMKPWPWQCYLITREKVKASTELINYSKEAVVIDLSLCLIRLWSELWSHVWKLFGIECLWRIWQTLLNTTTERINDDLPGFVLRLTFSYVRAWKFEVILLDLKTLTRLK